MKNFYEKIFSVYENINKEVVVFTYDLTCGTVAYIDSDTGDVAYEAPEGGWDFKGYPDVLNAWVDSGKCENGGWHFSALESAVKKQKELAAGKIKG